jgi:hypothetical protein
MTPYSPDSMYFCSFSDINYKVDTGVVVIVGYSWCLNIAGM